MRKEEHFSNKFWQLTQLLYDGEWRRFGLWLHSPWCNSQKKLQQLYNLLKRGYPDFEHKRFAKENLFAKLYPQHAYNAKWMRNLLSDLIVELERFILHERIRRDSKEGKLALADEYLKRGRKDWFFKGAKRLVSDLEDQAVKDWEDHLALALLNEKMYRNVESSERQQVGADYLYESEQCLDYFYRLGKMRCWVERAERQKIVGEERAVEQRLGLFGDMRQGDLKDASVWYWQYLEEGSSFEDLKEKYLKHRANYDRKDQKIMIFLLLNKGGRLWLKNAKILEEAFALYRLGLEEKLLLHHGRMTSNTFGNIVSIGNTLKAFDFVQAFVPAYLPLLAPEVQDDASDWARTHLFYNQGKRDLSQLELKLSQQKQDRTIFSLRTKVLLLQIRFDNFLAEKKVGLQWLDFSLAFEKQLVRNRNFSAKRLQGFKKFVQYSRRLYRLVGDPNVEQADLIGIESELLDEAVVRARKWLLNKIRALKK
ncbi:MAG: hypothetical protein AAF990_18580 [Bacteroidota bacterium]